MKTPQKPRKKLSQKEARKRWLKTPAGQKWIAERQQEQLDRELLHGMASWL
ncbi:hypothetical protein ACOS7Q_24935 [Escherichia coli]|uniref:hypothetical protein n=1 Tax=Escherichia coli TaxID=562 RepID=UPI00374CF407|nr:hypothetical protein [Escherichia coli]